MDKEKFEKYTSIVTYISTAYEMMDKADGLCDREMTEGPHHDLTIDINAEMEELKTLAENALKELTEEQE